MKIIVDTGFVVSLFNEKDPFHVAAVELEERIGESYDFVSTVFVFHEIFHLLSKRAGYYFAVKFMDCAKDGMIQLAVLPDDWIQKATNILHKYSDRKLDLADASIVVLADELNIGDVATIDFKDFEILRWKNGKNKFRNLMLKP